MTEELPQTEEPQVAPEPVEPPAEPTIEMSGDEAEEPENTPDLNNNIDDNFSKDEPEIIKEEEEKEQQIDEAVKEDEYPTQLEKDIDDTVEHYLESSQDFTPEWIHHLLHSFDSGPNGEPRRMSPKLIFITVCVMLLEVLIVLVFRMVKTCSNDSFLRGKLGESDKKLHQTLNENKALKSENETLMKTKGGSGMQMPPAMDQSTSQMVQQQQAAYREIEALKAENQSLRLQSEADRATWTQERTTWQQLSAEKAELEAKCETIKADLAAAEALATELVEEKQRSQSNNSGIDLSKAIEGLKEQLDRQQQVHNKYEAKIKKRESELREKTHDLRKMRMDLGNANLEINKLKNEGKETAAKLEALNELEGVKEEMEGVKMKLIQAQESAEEKEGELEAKTTEVEVLKVTVEQLKQMSAAINSEKQKEADKDNEDGDGWDIEDDSEYRINYYCI